MDSRWTASEVKVAKGEAVKLTKKVVDQIDPTRGRHYIWDAELKGFGLQVEASGTRTYFVRYRPKGLGREGQRRFVKVGRHGDLTAEQARATAKVILGSVAAGEDPADQRDVNRTEHVKRRDALTFADLAAAFLKDHVAAKRKARTAENYEILLRKHAIPILGSKKAETVTRADIARLHVAMQATPHNANRVVAVIGSMYTFGFKHELLREASNPVRGIEKYREEGRERYLSSDELGRLGAALEEGETVGIAWYVQPDKPASKHLPKKADDRRVKIDPHAAAAIRLLILTGARLREILGLRWGYVDMERGLLMLPDSKTGRKTIVLSEAAFAVLAALSAASGHGDSDRFVIAGRNSDRARADLQRPWAAVRRHAKLEGVRLHDLRHTFASLGAGAGLGLPIVGKLLGHAHPQTTARYAHLDADPLRRATDLIGRQIAAAMRTLSPRGEGPF